MKLPFCFFYLLFFLGLSLRAESDQARSKKLVAGPKSPQAARPISFQSSPYPACQEKINQTKKPLLGPDFSPLDKNPPQEDLEGNKLSTLAIETFDDLLKQISNQEKMLDHQEYCVTSGFKEKSCEDEKKYFQEVVPFEVKKARLLLACAGSNEGLTHSKNQTINEHFKNILAPRTKEFTSLSSEESQLFLNEWKTKLKEIKKNSEEKLALALKKKELGIDPTQETKQAFLKAKTDEQVEDERRSCYFAYLQSVSAFPLISHVADPEFKKTDLDQASRLMRKNLSQLKEQFINTQAQIKKTGVVTKEQAFFIHFPAYNNILTQDTKWCGLATSVYAYMKEKIETQDAMATLVISATGIVAAASSVFPGLGTVGMISRSALIGMTTGLSVYQYSNAKDRNTLIESGWLSKTRESKEELVDSLTLEEARNEKDSAQVNMQVSAAFSGWALGKSNSPQLKKWVSDYYKKWKIP